MTSRFIIEHASRGAFIEFHNATASGEVRPRFRWSCLRTDPDVRWWYHREHAERVLAQVLPFARQAYIVELSDNLWKKRTKGFRK
jgi:hypothetical protein